MYPKIQYEDFKRGLCILDPYGLNLNWDIVRTAGIMKTIDIFLNFPTMDMNRTALWHDQSKVNPKDIARMNAFWGDDSWKDDVFYKQPTLFGEIDNIKRKNKIIVGLYVKRLKEIAGFKCVPEPIPMRNSKNSEVYYLIFASHQHVAKKIVEDIFDKYKDRRV